MVNGNENLRGNAPGGSSDPPRGILPWVKLVVGLVLIVLFIYGVGPLVARLPSVGTMLSFIERRDIRATALYYTDIDEFGEATASLRNSLEYSP